MTAAQIVLRILAVQKGKLDLAFMRHWCGVHGSGKLLEELMAKAEEIA